MRRMNEAPVILGANRWKNNSALIRDVATLHLQEEWLTLDATYGRGVFWREWCPQGLVTNDLHADGGLGYDFRSLPFEDGTFEAVIFDPPYIAIGKVSETKSRDRQAEFLDRFGLDAGGKRSGEVLDVMLDGMTECTRVLRCQGVLLVKCQDYISEGRYQPHVFAIQQHALDCLDLRMIDRFEMVTPVRAQPPGRPQRTARRNHSTLLVFQNKGRRSHNKAPTNAT